MGMGNARRMMPGGMPGMPWVWVCLGMPGGMPGDMGMGGMPGME